MAHFLLTNLEKVLPIKDNLTADNNARRVGNKAQDRKSAHALATSTLTNEADTLPFVDIIRQAINGFYLAFLGVEIGSQVFYFK